MMKNAYPIVAFILFILSVKIIAQTSSLFYPWIKHKTIKETIDIRIPPPPGYRRIPVAHKSFAAYLRGLPLLPKGAAVRDYLGNIKKSAQDTTVAAVVDYPIRGKKLEQCMDMVLRFRAEYLWSHQRKYEIAFYLPGGYLLKWTDWERGLRPRYHGINVTLVKAQPTDSSRKNFEKFLWEVFYRSNTQTAYFAYPKIKIENVQIGDFIVKRGKRGHAVLIVDVAVDSLGNKVALIGQGDTPACQFYLLNYRKGNPWVPLNLQATYPPLPIKKKMYWEGLRRF